MKLIVLKVKSLHIVVFDKLVLLERKHFSGFIFEGKYFSYENGGCAGPTLRA
jgi:hypothetical protein